jgi:predicted ATPase/DNA-binding SARP family transcriptional activator
MELSFRLLGPFEVVCSDGPLVLGGRKQRRLFGLLALRSGATVPLDALVDAVWGEDAPASATATVQAYVSRLRALLAPYAGVSAASVIVGAPGGYRLEVPAGRVDVHDFDHLSHTGLAALRAGEFARAAKLLGAATGLWRGPLLSDLDVGGLLADERQRLDAAYDATTDGCYDAELATGRHAEVLPALRQRVATSVLREQPYRQLMVALEHSGRQAEAIAVYAQVRRLFRAELGVEPGEELRELHARLLTRSPGRSRRGGGLPAPVNALVGREADVKAVEQLLTTARLVTVTGPAGAGKTRLAVEVARRLDDDLPDGAWLVELSAAREDGAEVARTVALALGVLEQPQRDLATSVAEAVSGRSLLLVLDNCEHVAAAVADVVSTMLRTAASLTVLATSQEALRVDGEHVYRLSPLAVPPADASVEDTASVAAVRLFVDRARAARPAFALSRDNVQAVACVCRELDGLPLALELAAATLGAVDIDHVASRLPDRFALLSRGPRTAPARHRSLHAAVSWSYDLLTDQERTVFHQLSVFAGGFSLEAAEDVCRVDGELTDQVLPVLAALVDKSFVQADAERSRYSLLQTLRIHAAQQLTASGTATEVRSRHAANMLQLCARAAAGLRGRQQLEWIGRLDEERDNVAAALRWSLENDDGDVALGIVATLWWYWWRNGHIPEGAQWAEQVLGRFSTPPSLRAAALVGTSHLWWKLGEFDRAEQACSEALELLGREPAPSPLAPAARGVLAMVARDRGDLQTARELLGGVLADYVTQAEPWGEAATLNMLVSVDRDSKDLEVATARLERSGVLFDELGDLWGQAWSAWLTGRVATRQRELERAAASLRHSIVLASELRHGFGVVLGLAGMAGIAAECGDFVAAARMLGATDALEQAMGFPVRAIEREDSAHDVTVTRAALGPAAYREHWLAGCRLSPDAAVTEALTCPLPT